MNLLEIVQSLHHEAKLPGDPTGTLTGISGRDADLKRWAIEAYNDIQRERDGKWNWLRGDFTLDTSNGDSSYEFGDAGITRFRAWDLDDRDPPHIFLVSDGADEERELVILDWRTFRRSYELGTHDADYPKHIAVDVDDNLRLGPTPDDAYRVSGSYWKSNQELSESGDTPEMPEDYHMLIVYQALTKYGYNAVAHETLARARAEGTRIHDALVMNQSYSRFSMSTAGTLA